MLSWIKALPDSGFGAITAGGAILALVYAYIQSKRLDKATTQAMRAESTKTDSVLASKQDAVEQAIAKVEQQAKQIEAPKTIEEQAKELNNV